MVAKQYWQYISQSENIMRFQIWCRTRVKLRKIMINACLVLSCWLQVYRFLKWCCTGMCTIPLIQWYLVLFRNHARYKFSKDTLIWYLIMWIGIFGLNYGPTEKKKHSWWWLENNILPFLFTALSENLQHYNTTELLMNNNHSVYNKYIISTSAHRRHNISKHIVQDFKDLVSIIFHVCCYIALSNDSTFGSHLWRIVLYINVYGLSKRIFLLKAMTINAYHCLYQHKFDRRTCVRNYEIFNVSQWRALALVFHLFLDFCKLFMQ